jgi:hypothetical protein
MEIDVSVFAPLNEGIQITGGIVDFEDDITIDFSNTGIPDDRTVFVENEVYNSNENTEIEIFQYGKIIKISGEGEGDWITVDGRFGLTLPIDSSYDSFPTVIMFKNENEWILADSSMGSDGRITATISVEALKYGVFFLLTPEEIAQ